MRSREWLRRGAKLAQDVWNEWETSPQQEEEALLAPRASGG